MRHAYKSATFALVTAPFSNRTVVIPRSGAMNRMVDRGSVHEPTSCARVVPTTQRLGMARPVRDTSETLKLQDDEPTSITFRSPTPADGATMWTLVRDAGGLDLNSPYAYLLAGHHFGSTSIVAETADGDLAGFVFAYPPPDQPDTVFVWQVITNPRFRGQGMGRRMLHQVIERARTRGIATMTATVTPSNAASKATFSSVARDLGVDYSERPCFGEELFPGDGEHEPEDEVRVGPFG